MLATSCNQQSRVKTSIALLDWDGSLCSGFTIVPWLKELCARGLVSGQALSQQEALFTAYEKGTLEHDSLASSSAISYAEAVAGLPLEMLEEAAKLFVKKDQARMFPMVAETLAFLQACQVQAVIISGAPEVVLSSYKALFPFNQLYALRLGTKGAKYRREILENPGLSSGKQSVITHLVTATGLPISLGIGNSSSDRPLLEAARFRVVVGNPTLAAQVGAINMDWSRLDESRWWAALERMLVHPVGQDHWPL